MDRINALGFIEVYGLVPGIEAADAMLKSANVRLLRQYEVHPGLITVVVEGDLAACQAAVNAGTAAASRIGKVVSSLLIPRPDGDTETMVLDLIATKERGGAARKKTPAAPAEPEPAPPSPATEARPETKPEAKPKQAAPATKKAPAKVPAQGAKPAKARGARSRKPSPKE